MSFRLHHSGLLLTAIIPCVGAAQTTHHVPGDFPKIQQAIDASANGDTVLVDPGTYIENLDFHGHAITITSSAGAATTILDGGGASAAVSFQTNEGRNSVLSGFTVQNGSSTSSNASAPEGGVYINQASPTIQNNTFRNNACNAITVIAGAPLIVGNDITTSIDAGTTLCYDTDNDRSVGPVAYGGAAIFLRGSAPATATSPYATIANNTLENNTQGASGGAILSLASGWIAKNNIIRNNLAGDGAALTHLTYFGGFTLAGNLIYGNGPTGNGFYKATVDVDNSGYITSGIGPFGIYIDNNTMTADSVGTGFSYASEIYIGTTPAPISLVNNIIDGGTIGVPALYCAPSYQQDATDVLAAGNNDIYNPSGGEASAGICAPVAGTFGNISADPQFYQLGAYPYEIPSSSPAAARGNVSYSAVLPQIGVVSPYLSADLAGHPRTVLDAIDMGAYQIPQTSGVVLQDKLIEAYPNAYELRTKPLIFTALIYEAGAEVDFYSDDVTFGSAIADQTGTATLTYGNFAPGAHEITARDLGSGSFFTISTPFFILVDKYTPMLSLASSLNPSPAGQLLTLTVTIQSSDTNQLAPLYLSDANGAVSLATLTPNTSGVATYTTSSLVPGTHELGVYYPGDSAHNPVRAFLTETITGTLPPPETTSTTLAVSPNPAAPGDPVSFLTTVTAASGANSPNGTIALTDNGSLLTSATLTPSGAGASNSLYTNSILALGTHTLIATYTPSDLTTFTASQSAAVTLVIANPIVIPPPADFSFTASPSPLTVATTHHASTTLTLTSLNGFSGTVYLACGTLPPITTCELTQPAVSLQSNATASATLTLDTDALLNFAANTRTSSSLHNELALATFLPFALFGLLQRRRRSARALVLSAICTLAATLCLTACSGKQPDHTPAGTYIVPLTATGTANGSSQALTHTVNLTLVVTP